MKGIHKPVLLKEVMDLLKLENGNIVVDATLGAGGHSLEILKRILPKGKLICFDQDERAIENFIKEIEKDEELKKAKSRIILINENFENLNRNLEDLKINSVGSVLADLGFSSDQLEDKKIGLSFQEDTALDMRLSRKGDLSALKVVNEYSEHDLKRIFRENADEKFAGKIARLICEKRGEAEIATTGQLVKIISTAIPKRFQYGKIHFATKTFQAIRMEVNRESEVLEKFLSQATDKLSKGGRLAIITFHSVEDRIVKNFFKDANRECDCPQEIPECRCDKKRVLNILNRKPIVATEEEIIKNPRARSAKLRVAEKV